MNIVCSYLMREEKKFSVPELDVFIKSIDWKSLSKEEKKEAEAKRKLYSDELIPLNGYVSNEYAKNSEVIITVPASHQPYYDAVITEVGEILEYVQITCAINTDSQALQTQAIAEQNPAEGKIHNLLICDNQLAARARNKNLPRKERVKCAEKFKFSPLDMCSFEEIKQNQLKLIKEAINKKIEKSKKQSIKEPRTLLVVYYANGQACYTDYDEFNISDIEDLMQYSNNKNLELEASKFSKIIIVNKCYMNSAYRSEPKPKLIWESVKVKATI